MIIIEEDESTVSRVKSSVGDDMEEEKLTPEEEKYRSAVALMESVDCVEVFEHSVASLRSAAGLFHELGEYKDSSSRAEKCLNKAEKEEKKGRKEAYQVAVKLCEEAESKSDFSDAITALERVHPFQDSGDRLEVCHQAIQRIEARRAWKNRLIVLAVFCLVFVIGAIVWSYL